MEERTKFICIIVVFIIKDIDRNIKTMGLLKSRSVTVSINRDPRTVYEFIFNLENLPKWASKAFQSIKQVKGEWIAETPQGLAKVGLAQRNDFGVLDHYVNLSSLGVEVYVPMRVVQNGINGSEVIFTLFYTTDMSEEKFAQDVSMVEQDLKNLKNIMEERN
ncbi:MAG: SRPBCC family protein [Nitrososphaeraceae archaeon]